MASALIGRRLGPYTVIAELGRGQHSTVYKAWQPSLERYVALKVLRRHDQETLYKFQAEARLTAQLVEQGVTNIRQVYQVGRSAEGDIFVALEFVEDSLRALLRRSHQRKQRMNPEAAARLLIPIARALDTIHSLGWVHLDIKPQNILISRDGRAMLADFGIAARRGTRTHACTPTYASPEQAAGDRPVGPWSDIYSLGAVLYEMVAGHPPVRGDHDIVLLNQHLEAMPPSPRQVNPQLTASQERAIYKALAKSPRDRFRTASEFVQAVLSTDTFFSTMVHTPKSVLGTTSGWVQRVPRLVLVGAIVAVLLLALALLGWALWPGPAVAPPSPAATTAMPPPTVYTATAPAATPTPTATIAPTVTLSPRTTVTATRSPAPRPTASPTP